MYLDGQYLSNNPTLHAEDSPWKAGKIAHLLNRNGLKPRTVCEIGCGAGGVLEALQEILEPECTLTGYEVSPQAFEICKQKTNPRLRFRLGSITEDATSHFDVLMLVDVIEHVDDYFALLREVRPRADFTVLHIPLDLSVQAVLRGTPLLRSWRQVGHIHFFSKETALESLKDAGYTVKDWFYTAGTVDLPSPTVLSAIAKLPRRLLFKVRQDYAVRILGGYSMMILAQ
jgi:2-polyprenyl-3-methyl-5-hydroxy-6-metoxy-1,4-benzoquinol methylase